MEGLEKGSAFEMGSAHCSLLALTRHWRDQGWVGTVILIALTLTGGSAYGGRWALGTWLKVT